MEVLTLTSENFEQEVLHADCPVLVDFWAAWCGPCRMVAPILDEIAQQAEGFKVGKLNVDEQREIAQKYGIMSIPTMIVFKNGEIANTMVGVRPKDAILEALA